MAQETTWVTPEAHARLVAELGSLVDRGDSADATARARIVELRTILGSVEVGTRPDDGLVETGMRVTVRSVEDSVETSFVLGDRALLGHDLGADVTVLSQESPLGAAVDGRHVGDQVTFTTPRGDRSVLIAGASPVG
ncbi:GreA/GreB family elongation factor [Demequina sp. SO4-18]|uniref:GreA/GreB family elongation factor n=1 Tax=Demequina sp. SO4-18 TaxID=3401026 RepID=UPI003B5A2048